MNRSSKKLIVEAQYSSSKKQLEPFKQSEIVQDLENVTPLDIMQDEVSLREKLVNIEQNKNTEPIYIEEESSVSENRQSSKLEGKHSKLAQGGDHQIRGGPKSKKR